MKFSFNILTYSVLPIKNILIFTILSSYIRLIIFIVIELDDANDTNACDLCSSCCGQIIIPFLVVFLYFIPFPLVPGKFKFSWVDMFAWFPDFMAITNLKKKKRAARSSRHAGCRTLLLQEVISKTRTRDF